ncbi:MAG TPA: M13 family metallopeptidase N-terminal domain-containing protein, partial [Moraxellaceae bacterium]
MKFLPALLGLALLAACSSQAPITAPAKNDALIHYGSWGVQTQYVSAAIRPGDDFYRHINQGWLDSATLPPGFAATSTFLELQLRTEKQLQAILTDVARQAAAAGSAEQQIADFHASYLDVARRDVLGVSPLLPDVQAALAADRPELARRMGRAGYGAIVDIGVLPDSANPGRYVLEVAQGDLGLPGRDYYLKNDAPFMAYRRAYVSYITGVFKRAGIPAAEEKVRAVLDFET